jgi:hypothetical protein
MAWFLLLQKAGWLSNCSLPHDPGPGLQVPTRWTDVDTALLVRPFFALHLAAQAHGERVKAADGGLGAKPAGKEGAGLGVSWGTGSRA